MLNQVSLFTENNEGGLFKITTILAKANINIYTMLANDSAEFGIVRLIVDKAETAIEVLKAEGYQCRQDKVIAVEMNDTPGYLDAAAAHTYQFTILPPGQAAIFPFFPSPGRGL